MTESQIIRAQGARAYRHGLPKDKNPYQWTSHRNGGVFKAAWWSAGWVEAESAAAQEKSA